MCHRSKSELEAYVQATMSLEQQDQIEQHLEECEACFTIYLDVIEMQPMDVALSENFTTDTMEQLEHLNLTPKKSNQNKIVGHYLLAAGLTIVLMLSGVFQNFLSVTTNLENKSSLTEQLMEKTNVVLEEMKGEYK
ncbi:zf-HC2 domain-containing protein [Aquibacillus sediminis]|uniref:zf-HC2 domain-containing protein n=1 Tax=Aquibacillus sediminis TaxID=2574734 RepID=UPI00148747F8|nr:zf-HC2 domain-containing protein [Aquibacillus sediminis]